MKTLAKLSSISAAIRWTSRPACEVAGTRAATCEVRSWVALNTSGGFGPSLLTTSDVESFLRMTGQRVTHWELEMLKVLDVTAMRVAQEGKAENG